MTAPTSTPRRVKATFDRAINQPARWKSLFGPIEACEVVDDYTVDISTTVPYGPILASTAMVYCGILSPAALEKYGQDYGRHPVGTGPFKFKEWGIQGSHHPGAQRRLLGPKGVPG